MGGITGLEQLLALERGLERLNDAPARAAARAVAPLMSVARAEWSAGEAPGGQDWDPLKAGSGTPLSALTSQIDGTAQGASVVITTPEEAKYHQGGFTRGATSEHRALREAQAAARSAKANADKEGMTRARARVRNVKKEIRARGTPVAKRPTLPGRRSLPVSWAEALGKAIEAEIADTLKDVR